MKKNKYIVMVLGLFIAFPSYAYIDPGTGLLFMQGLFALIGFLVAFVKNPVNIIRNIIKKLKLKK